MGWLWEWRYVVRTHMLAKEKPGEERRGAGQAPAGQAIDAAVLWVSGGGRSRREVGCG